MTLIVETGTGSPDSESYVSAADCTTYHTKRGNEAWVYSTIQDQETALRRATSYLDPMYRAYFPGYQAQGRGQALEWPRIGAYVTVPDNGRADAFYFADRRDYEYINGIYYIPANTVPKEMVIATCEAALREVVSPNSLNPDQTRNDILSSFKAGPVVFTYNAGSPESTIFKSIEYALRPLLMPNNKYSGRVTR